MTGRASDYDWPRPAHRHGAACPECGRADVHRRAAINLLLGAIRLGDPATTCRAWSTVTAFQLRHQPGYTALDADEVATLLGLFEGMPGGHAG